MPEEREEENPNQDKRSDLGLYDSPRNADCGASQDERLYDAPQDEVLYDTPQDEGLYDAPRSKGLYDAPKEIDMNDASDGSEDEFRAVDVQGCFF